MEQEHCAETSAFSSLQKQKLKYSIKIVKNRIWEKEVFFQSDSF